jgi:hypothetical protein
LIVTGDVSDTSVATTLGWTGFGINTAIVLFLSGIALFDRGHLDTIWLEHLPFLLLILLPAALAVGGSRGRPNLFLTAGVTALLLSFLSLAGTTLPLLIPAFLYIWAAVKMPTS